MAGFDVGRVELIKQLLCLFRFCCLAVMRCFRVMRQQELHACRQNCQGVIHGLPYHRLTNCASLYGAAAALVNTPALFSAPTATSISVPMPERCAAGIFVCPAVSRSVTIAFLAGPGM